MEQTAEKRGCSIASRYAKEMNDTLEESFISGTSKPFGRRIWKLYPESGRPSCAAIFLDGELYLEKVKAVLLRQLEAERNIPPTLAVFVSSCSAAARHSDYTCDADYAAFLSQDLVPWLLNSHAEIGDVMAMVGLSLSGLAVAHAALTYQSQFRAAICQSPSFWWNDESWSSSLPPASGSRPAFWISVGDQETDRGVSHPPSDLLQQKSQIESCERGCDALREAKYNVNYRVFQGGHDPERWREDLVLALPWVAKSA
jgi:enterochelin esterase-like enzyme